MNEIYVTRSSMPTIDEYIDEIKDLWDNHILTNMGYKHQKFQKMIMDYLEVPGVELMSNGHMSLELSIQALLSAGDMHSKYSSVNNAGKMEIITTPFTFASTTHAIVRNGFEPIFCDINPIDYTIDVNKIEDLITDRTVAILPVHVGSNENCFKMWRALHEMGIFANPVISPAVPPGRALIRLTLMATHTEAHVQKIIDSFAQAGRSLGIIK